MELAKPYTHQGLADWRAYFDLRTAGVAPLATALAAAHIDDDDDGAGAAAAVRPAAALPRRESRLAAAKRSGIDALAHELAPAIADFAAGVESIHADQPMGVPSGEAPQPVEPVEAAANFVDQNPAAPVLLHIKESERDEAVRVVTGLAAHVLEQVWRLLNDICWVLRVFNWCCVPARRCAPRRHKALVSARGLACPRVCARAKAAAPLAPDVLLCSGVL